MAMRMTRIMRTTVSMAHPLSKHAELFVLEQSPIPTIQSHSRTEILLQATWGSMMPHFSVLWYSFLHVKGVRAQAHGILTAGFVLCNEAGPSMYIHETPNNAALGWR